MLYCKCFMEKKLNQTMLLKEGRDIMLYFSISIYHFGSLSSKDIKALEVTT